MDTLNFQATNRAQSDRPKTIGRSSNPSLFVLSGLAILLVIAVFLLRHTSEAEIGANNVQDPPHNFTPNLTPPESRPLSIAQGDIGAQTIAMSNGSPTFLSVAFKTDTSPNVAPVQDVVWYVIVGSFPRNQRRQANAHAARVRAQGYNMNVYNSGDFGALTPGLWVVMDGPYTQRQAQRVLNNVRSVVKGAYIKLAVYPD